MVGCSDRFRVAVCGGLALDEASVIQEGEFPLHHDHLGGDEARGERIEILLAQRISQRIHPA